MTVDFSLAGNPYDDPILTIEMPMPPRPGETIGIGGTEYRIGGTHYVVMNPDTRYAELGAITTVHPK